MSWPTLPTRPLVLANRLIGVFDVDSPAVGHFDEDDRVGLESLVGVFLEAIREDTAAELSF
jgi:L-methionine (R)-S-oxide reductase